MFHRWRNIWLVLAFTLGSLTGYAQTITSSYSSKTLSVTVTSIDPVSVATGQWKVYYSWTWTNGGSNGVGSGEMYSGSTLRVYQTNASTVGTGSFTVPESQASVTISTRIDYYGPQNIQSATIAKPSPPTHKVTVSLTNPTAFSVKYKVMQGSTLLGEVTLTPGQSLIQQFTTSSTAEVVVLSEVLGLGRDGDGWVVNEGAVTQVPINGTSSATPVPSSDTTTPATAIGTPNVPQGANPTNVTNNQTNNTIWSPGGSPDALTNAVYREGVNKQLTGQAAQLGALSQIVQNTRETADNTKGIKDTTDKWKKHLEKVDEALENNPDPTQQQAARTAAAVQGALGMPPPMASAANPGSGSMPNFEIALPARMGGVTVNLNPFTGSRFAALAAAFRYAIQWLALVLLGRFVWQELGGYLKAASMANQARGNAVIAGTGAQATGLAAAGVIAAAVVVMVTALFSFTFGEFGVQSVLSIAMGNPLAAWPAGAVWMLDQLFPLATLISCFVARLAFSVYAIPLYAACAATIRFVVP